MLQLHLAYCASPTRQALHSHHHADLRCAGFVTLTSQFGSAKNQFGITSSNWQTCYSGYANCAETLGQCTEVPLSCCHPLAMQALVKIESPHVRAIQRSC